ncbi:MAG: hypothetical protein MZV64_23370 [Ignavibacteriales bacterium]|nr:hypothetical protein [Ignavibacteriales bacterium]
MASADRLRIVGVLVRGPATRAEIAERVEPPRTGCVPAFVVPRACERGP